MLYQTELNNPVLRKYGCYFVSLFNALELHRGKFTQKEVIEDLFEDYQLRGWIDADATVLDPAAILSDQSREKIGMYSQDAQYHIPFLSLRPLPEDSWVILRFRDSGRPLGLRSHFVLGEARSLRVVWDPIEGGSQTVKNGQLMDLRVFLPLGA